MSATRFQLVRDLLTAVRDMDEAARRAYLDDACADDDDLRSEVESLLAHAAQPPEFLESPLPTGGLVSEAFAADAPPPEFIGRYRIVEVLGEGGMGVVYLAEQTTPVRRRVAVKVIKLGMDTRKVIARFKAERQTLAIDEARLRAWADEVITRHAARS